MTREEITMRTFRGGWMKVAALAAILGAGLSTHLAWARKKSARTFSAQINGRQLTARNRHTLGTYNGSIFLFEGSKPGGLRGTTRTAAFTCVAIGLETATFPLTLACGGTYQEVQRTTVRSWSSLHGLQVTIDSFDGTRATGTFSGTLEITSGSAGPLAPAPVENGRFSVIVTRS